ncbi:MAG: branched-chain amino acid ABC transporter permease [Actinobacteria bacterium]|nr:branched-chain amino acid ABC transporter permease [Actinomycetota bacterium]
MLTIERGRWLALAVVGAGAVALPYMVDSFYVNMATQALYLGLFALSINLIAGYGGMVTLGQAGISGIAGYTLGIAATQFGMSLGPALVVGFLATIVVAVVFGALAVRTGDVYFLMITLAQGMIIWGIAQRWTTVTGGDNGLRGIDRPGFALEYWKYYYFTLGVVAVCTLLVTLITRSTFGLSLKGIRESEGRMRPLGYNVTLHKFWAFTIAGAVAAIAGLLLAMFNQFVSPAAVHVKASADGLLMSILGGMGTIAGAFVGSSLFVVVTNYVSGYFDRWPTLLGLIFVLTILFAQDGIVGAWNRLVWAPLLRRRGRELEAERTVVGVGGPLARGQPVPASTSNVDRGGERAPVPVGGSPASNAIEDKVDREA